MDGTSMLQIAIICFAPFFANLLVRKFKMNSWLSPVVLAYGTGILIANLNLIGINTSISTEFSHATVLLAIPLLLYATDFMAWFRNAKSTILAFLFSVLATVIAVVLLNYYQPPVFAKPSIVAGMLVGVYSGGTPNMQAVGIALGAEEETYVLLNAADIFCGGIYLLILTSVAHRLLSFFLPNYTFLTVNTEDGTDSIEVQTNLKDQAQAVGFTILVVAASVGLTLLTPGGLGNTGLLILLLTTLSILASFIPKVRNWQGSYEVGEYLLLMFCVAVGLLSDFSTLMEEGGEVIRYMGAVLIITVILHLLLCKIFKIDRDTALITSTAAVYGPVFVGQVASAIGNRELVVAGIACGLVGMAIGNYLGIGIAWLFG